MPIQPHRAGGASSRKWATIGSRISAPGQARFKSGNGFAARQGAQHEAIRIGYSQVTFPLRHVKDESQRLAILLWPGVLKRVQQAARIDNFQIGFLANLSR